MLVQHGWIDLRLVIINETLGVVKDFIAKRILKSDENWQPFVVGDKLVFCNVDSSSFLEEGLVVPMRI